MVDNSFQFILLQITVGMAAVSSLKDMSQRSQLAQTALYIFLSYLLMYLAFEFISEGDVQRINWVTVVYFGISSVLLLLAYVLIYFFEKIFNLVSSVTLVELTNINSDLMMEFSERAPGTFQHSLQVSNLATEAAKKINANSLLVRTGALYHDIGKMKHPEYFIENQMGGKNPLIDYDFEVASKIVINHVTDGVEIAKKNHLPQQIINFIGTHHGFCKTKYFYNSYILANPDKKPNDAVFTYPGPLPNNKETAILMMADAVEARSRSLGVYTEESINEMEMLIVKGPRDYVASVNLPLRWRLGEDGMLRYSNFSVMALYFGKEDLFIFTSIFNMRDGISKFHHTYECPYHKIRFAGLEDKTVETVTQQNKSVVQNLRMLVIDAGDDENVKLSMPVADYDIAKKFNGTIDNSDAEEAVSVLTNKLKGVNFN